MTPSLSAGQRRPRSGGLSAHQASPLPKLQLQSARREPKMKIGGCQEDERHPGEGDRRCPALGQKDRSGQEGKACASSRGARCRSRGRGGRVGRPSTHLRKFQTAAIRGVTASREIGLPALLMVVLSWGNFSYPCGLVTGHGAPSSGFLSELGDLPFSALAILDIG